LNMASSPALALPAREFSPAMMLLLAFACGLTAANVYYAQPLIAPISASLGIAPQAAGLISTLTQLGYGLGLLLVVPLADLRENRALVTVTLLVAAVGLAGAAWVTSEVGLLLAALLIGLGSTAVQILVPLAAHLAPEEIRGRVVGNVTCGVMTGIICARPLASAITAALSWRAMFVLSALFMSALAITLRNSLPSRQPPPGLGYGPLLASMGSLLRRTPVLQRRALYHTLVFAGFSLFWTTVPLQLAAEFGLTQTGIALFALSAIVTAVAAPITGRIADRGWSEVATGIALALVTASFLLARTRGSHFADLVQLVVAAVILSIGTTSHFTLGQRDIFSLPPELRGRLNGLFMATFFTGGAAGSALGAWTFAHSGWAVSMGLGLGLSSLGLLCFVARYLARRVPVRQVR
jgi:predicted MFS family arabinose efflux permease